MGQVKSVSYERRGAYLRAGCKTDIDNGSLVSGDRIHWGVCVISEPAAFTQRVPLSRKHTNCLNLAAKNLMVPRASAGQ